MLRTVVSFCVAGFVANLSGCVLEQAPEKEPAEAQSAGAPRIFDLDPVIVVSKIPDKEKGDAGVGRFRPDGSSGAQPADEDTPTDIIVATCQSVPTEVAVPLNADDGKFCDTVQVYPYREDDNGAYGVSGAEIDWQLPEQDVAFFAAPAYGPGGSVRRLAVGTDAFWSSDKWDEPETLLTVCAKPPADKPHAFLPICRSLPVRATVNVEGAWCFSGATFDGECHGVDIKQDGRQLYVDDDVLSDGRLWVRSVKFNRDNDYLYDGVLDSHDYMYGIVRQNGQTEVLGTWTAWKLPLY